jgi:hypothetical protein
LAFLWEYHGTSRIWRQLQAPSPIAIWNIKNKPSAYAFECPRTSIFPDIWRGCGANALIAALAFAISQYQSIASICANVRFKARTPQCLYRSVYIPWSFMTFASGDMARSWLLKI